jgi:hypothetical protein
MACAIAIETLRSIRTCACAVAGIKRTAVQTAINNFNGMAILSACVDAWMLEHNCFVLNQDMQ